MDGEERRRLENSQDSLGVDPPDGRAHRPSTDVDPPNGRARQPPTDPPDGRKVPLQTCLRQRKFSKKLATDNHTKFRSMS